KSESLENLIRSKVSKLEKVCDHITSCRVAIEKPNTITRRRNPYRVRIDLTVPPGHNVVVSKEPSDNEKEDPLPTVVRDAFNAAQRRINKIVQLQRKDVKSHPEQEVRAIVSRIFPMEGYGFLRTINGREIYFHRNAVVNEDFDRMQEGTGVRFFEVEGEKGPQASTIQSLD